MRCGQWKRSIGVRLACAGLAAGLGAGLASAPGVAQDFTMKLGTVTVNDVQHEWMKRYAARVEKRSGGRIAAKLFPVGQLGSIQRQIEGVQLGTQEGYTVPPAFFVGVDPRFQVTAAPGVFHSPEQVIATLRDPEFRSAFLKLGTDKGLKPVSLFFYAPTSIVTKSPVRRLDDFKGLKIRVFASPMQTVAMERIGAAPSPMPLGDTLPALQRGAIDGVFGSVGIFVPFKYYNTAKYLTRTQYSYVTAVAVLSKTWFDRLPKDLQTILVEEGEAVEPELNAWAKDFAARGEGVWQKNGGELIDLSAKDRAEMMQRLSTVGEAVLSSQPDVKALYDLMVERAKAHEKS